MGAQLLKSGGKRVWPLLVLYSGLVFTGEPSVELIRAAAAVELTHMASLVHDDIIDQATERRNQPSLNHVWGNHLAVLGGDYLFAKAFGLLSGNQLYSSLNLMVEAIENMCAGEILEARDCFNLEVTLERYYERITKKSAIFLQCCCRSGATVAGVEGSKIRLIGEYGLHLGLAFQIVDDLLDYWGDPQTMGKPKYEDIRQGNLTLPVILIMNTPEYGPWLWECISNRRFGPGELYQLEEVLKLAGAMNQAFSIAESHVEVAKNIVKQLPVNEYSNHLFQLADRILVRAT
jgi:heptaprenyl diphosphate synthase